MTTAFIDDMREAFGADQINPSIKSGMAGEGAFFAAEDGHEVGSRPRDMADRTVNGLHLARAGRCDGCRHIIVKIISPDGKRLRTGCKIYKGLTSKCADWSAK